ncbi:uncharacterized protein LOC124706021 [Lolium rigidum]|uniref:uncharacterized protein LOC124706021 n=1 Tax=Lolium rigidum TaxID=89674 RepID=UPI001F5E3043|nr:uncharacterized protein LOC124706021 [Lolium rigidum]
MAFMDKLNSLAFSMSCISSKFRTSSAMISASFSTVKACSSAFFAHWCVGEYGSPHLKHWLFAVCTHGVDDHARTPHCPPSRMVFLALAVLEQPLVGCADMFSLSNVLHLPKPPPEPVLEEWLARQFQDRVSNCI